MRHTALPPPSPQLHRLPACCCWLNTLPQRCCPINALRSCDSYMWASNAAVLWASSAAALQGRSQADFHFLLLPLQGAGCEWAGAH